MPVPVRVQSARPRTTTGPSTTIIKPVGPRCNLDCTYCYYLPTAASFPPDERFTMPPAVLEAVVTQALAAAPGPVVHFVWHGGEPLLAGRPFYERAFALQERLTPAGWTVTNSIQTNGTLLDDRWADFLVAHRVAVGLSIDGSARTHDRLRLDRRGRPTYQRARAGFERLSQRGAPPDVLCTVNAETAARPLEVYDSLTGLGARWIQFIPVVEEADGSPTPAAVSAGAYGAFLTAIFDRWVRHDIDRVVVQTFFEGLLAAAGRPGSLCVSAETCGQVLAVEHDGSVYSCDHFVRPEFQLGSVLVDSLATMATSARQHAFGQAKRDALDPECAVCPVLAYCHGGCPKDRGRYGSPLGRNALCAGYRAFYLHAAPQLTRMAELAATGGRASSIMAELAASEDSLRAQFAHAGRNEPCPCGSGRKFKQCHGQLAR